MAELGSLGPILGDEKCAHAEITYYDSGYEGAHLFDSLARGAGEQ